MEIEMSVTITRYNTPKISMKYTEWRDKYLPEECSINDGDDVYDGCLYPPDSRRVYAEHRLNPHSVWTLLCEHGRHFIVEGYRGVEHRLGYFITMNPYEGMQRFEVDVI